MISLKKEGVWGIFPQEEGLGDVSPNIGYRYPIDTLPITITYKNFYFCNFFGEKK